MAAATAAALRRRRNASPKSGPGADVHPSSKVRYLKQCFGSGFNRSMDLSPDPDPGGQK